MIRLSSADRNILPSSFDSIISWYFGSLSTSSNSCISVRCDHIDEVICNRALEIVKPDQLKLAIKAYEELEGRNKALDNQWRMKSRAQTNPALKNLYFYIVISQARYNHREHSARKYQHQARHPNRNHTPLFLFE